MRLGVTKPICKDMIILGCHHPSSLKEVNTRAGENDGSF